VTGESDSSVTLWDAAAEQPAKQPFPPQAKGLWSVRTRPGRGPGVVHAVGFSSDGRRVYAVVHEGQVKAWDRASGKELHSFQASPHARFLPDGARLVAMHPEGVGLKVWQLDTGRCVQTVAEAAGSLIQSVSPDGQRVLTLKREDDPKTRKTDEVITEWDLATGKRTRTLGRWPWPRLRSAPAYLPDGRTVLLREEHGYDLWDLRTGKAVPLPGGLRDFQGMVLPSPDGTRAVTVDDKYVIRLNDFVTGRVLSTLPKFNLSRGPSRGIHFAPDGKQLLLFGGWYDPGPPGSGTYDDDRMLVLWDIEHSRSRILAIPWGFAPTRP
jgi:WD40 repeat protein